MTLTRGIEPTTYWLRANWGIHWRTLRSTKRATGAGFRSPVVVAGVAQYRAVCHQHCHQNPRVRVPGLPAWVGMPTVMVHWQLGSFWKSGSIPAVSIWTSWVSDRAWKPHQAPALSLDGLVPRVTFLLKW